MEIYRVNLHIFSQNTGKYGPEITPYLDTFHAVTLSFGSESVCEIIICMHGIIALTTSIYTQELFFGLENKFY